MRTTLLTLAACLLVFQTQVAFGQASPTPRLTATTGANQPIRPDSSVQSNNFPNISVQKAMPVGDTMTATLSTSRADPPGGPGRIDIAITNANGSVPTWTGTPQGGTQGMSFFTNGIVNGNVVSDIEINGVRTPVRPNLNIKTGYLTIAAFLPDGAGGINGAPLGDWLRGHGFNDPSMLAFPDFYGADDTLYVGVDLAQWASEGFNFDATMFDRDFSVNAGRSSALPGFFFSSTALTFTETGWRTVSVYSGVATLDSMVLVGAVPLPGTTSLVALGALLMLGRGLAGSGLLTGFLSGFLNTIRPRGRR